MSGFQSSDSSLITFTERQTFRDLSVFSVPYLFMKLLKSQFAIIYKVVLLTGLWTGGMAISQAQIPGLKGVIDGPSAAGIPQEETQEQTLKRYEEWELEARVTLARLESAALPPLVSEGEVELRRRKLEQLMLLLTRATKSANAATDAREAVEDSRAAISQWKGFSEPPPFSLFMVDELLNEEFVIKAALKSAQASLENFERLLGAGLAELKAAEGEVNNGINAVNAAKADSEAADAAKWRLDGALETVRLLGIRVGLADGSCAIQKDRIIALNLDLGLIQRKAAEAKKNSSLTDADLEKIKRFSDERKAGFQKEFASLSKRLKVAIASRDKAKLSAATPATEAPDPIQAAALLELAKFRLRVAEGRIDALQSVGESYEGLAALENILVMSYTNRSLILRAKDPGEKAAKIESLVQIQDRLQAWVSVLRNEINETSADLSKLESRASSISSDDASFPLINEQRAAKSEKITMLQRLSKAAVLQRRLLTRWLDEYAPDSTPRNLRMRVKHLGVQTWAVLKNVWQFKIMTFENKTEIDGRTIISKAPFTLGMLLGAILFFFLGYFIISRFTNRVQNAMITRGRVAQAQAKTLRNWLMLFASFFLVIGAFSVLGIPLTAFAFFGGALAIGFGFGMQTLIKNFISGIILLFERKVRVGDLLEVDGFIGRVVEINTRSSIIRNIDGMETLVPNSLFLENRVTNWTLSNSKIRRTLRVGVAYGTPPQQVMDVLLDAASRHGLVCKDPAPYAVFEDFGESALVFNLYFWLDLAGAANVSVVASDLRLIIEKRFEEKGIGVPFPQRDLRLSSDHPLQIQLVKKPQESEEL